MGGWVGEVGEVGGWVDGGVRWVRWVGEVGEVGGGGLFLGKLVIVEQVLGFDQLGGSLFWDMKLWLVSFLILFFGAEAVQWVLQFHWFSGVELSLPVVVMGGIGLAIASNYRQFQALGLLPEFFPNPELPSPTEPATTTSREATPPQPAETPAAAATDSRTKEDSISFEIRKPKPVSFEIRRSGKS